MEITSIESFLPYWENIRVRTMRVVRCIPADNIEWTYAPGKFTLGDLVRHLATIERYMYAEAVSGRRSAYPGCRRELADGLEGVLAYIDRLHRESVEIFAQLTPNALKGK
ncbi:MAG: DinB family protein, partial [Terriglobales bacterium]